MARIVELVLILNGLGGIATYLGFKVRRTRQAAKHGISKVAGLAGVEVYHEADDDLPDPGSFGGTYPYTPNEKQLGYGTEHDPRTTDHTPHFKPYDENCEACNPKRSRLARFGDTIR